MNFELKKAIKIGSICVFSYIVSYFVRNLLSVSTPEMLETGKFTKEFIGTLSSVYFLTYAIGQLINGSIGDKITPKIMVGAGLVICGAATLAFGFVSLMPVQLLLFIIMGFSLSMLRGPLVKTISENSLPKYAQVSCVLLSFAGFSGPLIASFFSLLFNWQLTFIVSGIISIAVGIIAYIVLDYFEKKRIIIISHKENKEHKSIFAVFKLEKFVYYMFIGALVEITMSSINFWVPTYLTERLAYSEDAAKMIFSVISLARSFTPFVTLFIFKWFKDNDVRMVKYSFVLATVLFAGVLFIGEKHINAFLFFLAFVAVGFASTLLWSVYIPSQSNSGMVSTVNGVLDFSGYAVAALANMVFSFTMGALGWNGSIVIWIVLMFSGVVASVIEERK